MTSKLGTLLGIYHGAIKHDKSLIPLNQVSFVRYGKKFTNIEYFFHIVITTAKITAVALGILYTLGLLDVETQEIIDRFMVSFYAGIERRNHTVIESLLIQFSIVSFIAWWYIKNPYILEITSSSARTITIEYIGEKNEIDEFYDELNQLIREQIKI